MESLGTSYRQSIGAMPEYAWPRDALPSSKAVTTASSKVAIIGAGPYGLSIAAHLRANSIDFRIFGSPMHSWRMRMPAGMFLKSEGFASSLQDPAGRFTLERFCAERGVRYAAKNVPVSLETFTEYGLAFQHQIVPNLEEKAVVGLDRVAQWLSPAAG